MRTIIQNIALIFVLIFVFTYCTDNNKESELEQRSINWKDSKAIQQAIEKYYKDSTVNIKRTSLHVKDKRRKLYFKSNKTGRDGKEISKEKKQQVQAKMEALLNKFPRMSVRNLLFRRADTANIHIVGRETAWLPVIMIEKTDTLVVDYKVIWDTNIVTFVGERKTVGAFRVSEVLIQEVNGEKRYEWVEDDGYWEKQLVRSDDM